MNSSKDEGRYKHLAMPAIGQSRKRPNSCAKTLHFVQNCVLRHTHKLHARVKTGHQIKMVGVKRKPRTVCDLICEWWSCHPWFSRPQAHYHIPTKSKNCLGAQSLVPSFTISSFFISMERFPTSRSPGCQPGFFTLFWPFPVFILVVKIWNYFGPVISHSPAPKIWWSFASHSLLFWPGHQSLSGPQFWNQPVTSHSSFSPGLDGDYFCIVQWEQWHFKMSALSD